MLPKSLLDKALRPVLSVAHQLVTLGRSVRRPRTFGAHALAFTPERRIILVKLRYAPGWRLPGGGRAEDEDPRAAILRELREEVGMVSHGTVRLACELDDATGSRRDLASLLIVEDVRYRRPGWSWEIEDVTEASLDNLPADLSPRMAGWIEALRQAL